MVHSLQIGPNQSPLAYPLRRYWRPHLPFKSMANCAYTTPFKHVYFGNRKHLGNWFGTRWKVITLERYIQHQICLFWSFCYLHRLQSWAEINGRRHFVGAFLCSAEKYKGVSVSHMVSNYCIYLYSTVYCMWHIKLNMKADYRK